MNSATYQHSATTVPPRARTSSSAAHCDAPRLRCSLRRLGVLEARSRSSCLVAFDEGAPFGRRSLVRFLVFGDWRERLSLLVPPLRGDEAPAALHEAEDADIPAVHFGHRSDADGLHRLVRLR